jgi:hypothetical protein
LDYDERGGSHLVHFETSFHYKDLSSGNIENLGEVTQCFLHEIGFCSAAIPSVNCGQSEMEALSAIYGIKFLFWLIYEFPLVSLNGALSQILEKFNGPYPYVARRPCH